MTLKGPLLLYLSAGRALGQSEAALRAYFEGKQVQPGWTFRARTWDWTCTRRQPPVDARALQSRMGEWGPAVRQGASIAVSAIRVKGWNIEIHLGGGGFNESAGVDYPTSAPRSRHEEDL